MIDRIKLTNFKCFKELDLELSNLNVLAGINSMGKSTVIQALLLLRQSFDKGVINRGLILNGEATQVGTGYDLLYRDSREDIVGIGIQQETKPVYLTYKYEKDADFLQLNNSAISIDDIRDINVFLPTFSYISAERIGPQRFYEKSYHEVFEKNQVGYKGEMFVDYLSERGINEKIENQKVLHPLTESAILIYQVEAWLSEVSPGIHVHTKKITEAGIVSISYKVSSNDFTPQNVGFGISYAAPLIVSLLKAKPGDLIILENPEAHLHPKGQRKIGELIAKACAGGVQIIVETHSDHLLNGIRLSVKNETIKRGSIRLNYFYLNEENVHVKCSPAILDDGRLSAWPDGFFDEWDKAIDELF